MNNKKWVECTFAIYVGILHMPANAMHFGEFHWKIALKLVVLGVVTWLDNFQHI